MVKSSERTGFEIAVIGMSGKFPGADNIGEFWENLKNGVESITFVTEDELREARIKTELIEDSKFVKCRGGILEGKEFFDASFFDYNPHEAEVMDPQMRMLHECAWSALEDAGYVPGSYGGMIGLYAGAADDFNWESLTVLSGKLGKLGGFSLMQATQVDFLTTRISYKLNLKGPSVTVQTACSTSLVAIHMACRALLSGECSIALAGGVSSSSGVNYGYTYQDGMILSPDGHCRAFDENSMGTVSGEGVALVVLKSLEDAEEDRDHIYAIVKSSAINNDGFRKAGYTAPSIDGQAQVIRAALHMAEVEPETIGYIETHGTATTLGDPIEFEALKVSFKTQKKGFCALGSLKANIGHLDRAAGVAGFIKTVLALKHCLIPPSLHYEKPNPKIDFDESPFYVNSCLSPWKTDIYPLRAGVSSFGIGGTNAHVILEEVPRLRDEERVSPSRQHQLILLSAKSDAALQQVTVNFSAYLKDNSSVNLADAAYTLKLGREALEYRRMLVCSNTEEAHDILMDAGSTKLHTYRRELEHRPLVFMFPGLGSQYVNMGRELYRDEPLFRVEMDRCFAILDTLLEDDVNIKQVLYPDAGPGDNEAGESAGLIDRTDISQLVVFIFEYALARLLMKWGIRPQAMIGYSFGEYVAALLSDVFSLEDGLALIVARGKLIDKLPEGAMLSVPLAFHQLAPLMNDELSIAIDNGTSCVVSGSVSAVECFESSMKEKKCICMRLPSVHAIHSKMMNPILEEFKAKLRGLTINEPQIPFISNVTGKPANAAEVVTPDYWAAHLKGMVRFADGLKELLKNPDTLFVEVGPGHELSALLLRHLGKERQQPVINLVKHADREISDVRFLLSKIGILWLYGIEIDWSAFYEEQVRYRIPLPTYPFERKRFWIEGNPFEIGRQMIAETSNDTKKVKVDDWFYLPQWERSQLLPARPVSLPEHSCCLMFIHGTPFDLQLVKHLRQAGEEVVTVGPAPTFKKTGESEYELDPRDSTGYLRLMEDLHDSLRAPIRIVHMWSISTDDSELLLPEPLDPETVNSAGDLGLSSIFYLVQAISKVGFNRDISLYPVTGSLHEIIGEEHLVPQQSPVLGLAKVIPQEYAYITCRCIDIGTPGTGMAGERLIGQLQREFGTASADAVVAYRGNYRWVQTFRSVSLPSTNGSGEDLPVLRQGGVYLLTGGMGNVGHALARSLASAYKAKLVLTGQTPLPPVEHWEEYLSGMHGADPAAVKIRRLRELEEMGAEILVFDADVADYARMAEVVAAAEERFGTIHGIIHAAGIMRGDTFKTIEELEKTGFQLHFQPKVYGLLVLEKLFHDKALDFCLLVSSPASILGGLGHAAYASANAFLDAYVYRHNRRNNGSAPWLTVNWGDWMFEKKREQLGPANLEDPLAYLRMSADEGIETFKRILNNYPTDISQVVVSTVDFTHRIKQWVNLEFRQEEGSGQHAPAQRHSRPQLLTPYVAPGNRVEEELSRIWQNYFNIEEIGVEDNFFELGATSLDIIQLNRKIKEVLGKDLPVVTLFRYPTISDLAVHLSSEKMRQEDSASEKGKERAAKMQQGRENLQRRSKARKTG
jgi:acyl transferase domain-containing protein/acyl carrier protein